MKVPANWVPGKAGSTKKRTSLHSFFSVTAGSAGSIIVGSSGSGRAGTAVRLTSAGVRLTTGQKPSGPGLVAWNAPSENTLFGSTVWPYSATSAPISSVFSATGTLS